MALRCEDVERYRPAQVDVVDGRYFLGKYIVIPPCARCTWADSCGENAGRWLISEVTASRGPLFIYLHFLRVFDPFRLFIQNYSSGITPRHYLLSMKSKQ